MSEFVVLGAGVTGMTAVSVLANLGANVTVVEQSSIVGGHVTTSSYCCKATSSCSRCGVCTAHTQLSLSLQNPRIELRTSSVIERFATVKDGVSVHISQQHTAINYRNCVSCKACVEACPVGCITEYRRAGITQYLIDNERCLRSKGESCTACSDACSQDAVSFVSDNNDKTLRASSLLVATGHTPYNAVKKPRYSYGTNSRIMTGLEAEAALANGVNFGNEHERVALIQCVGSRDPSIGRNFCSGVCCAYALRIARMLKYRTPSIHVAVYYIDLQNFDREFSSLLSEVKGLGVELIQGLPFAIDEEADGSLAFTVETANGEHDKVHYDRAILSVGIDTREDAADVADTIGLSINEHGFFISKQPNVYTNGTCAAPMSIPESMAAARTMAHTMWSGATDD